MMEGQEAIPGAGAIYVPAFADPALPPRDADVPPDPCLHERFAAQAARTPHAVALVFEGETLSYGELNARTNRLAHHLRSLGVGPETRVGICVERSPEMVVGVLGILKAGGAYVPLDPGYPSERLSYMLDDSAPAAVLVQTHLRDRVESAGVPVVELDAAAPAWASLPATDPERGGLTAEHLAYVIYTSGSTGRPKGVRVPHGSVAATLAVAGDAFGFDANDRVPSLASFAFDIWIFETLLPLLGGGSVRLVPRDRVVDVPRLVEDLARCTSVHAVPALMRRIVEEVRATPEGVLGVLRHAFVGGDAVAPDLLEEMRTAFPAAEIHVLYGPTEAAIICATHRLGEEAAARQMVGRPLGNAAFYVVEPGGGVAPVGVAGELWLGGASVARDYLGRPGLTAERFIPDPFSAQPGARLYRTGDRVRWAEVRECDGDDDSREADPTLALSHSRTFALEFLGRTDHQVKVRGFRIELGEIEARLAEHPGVRAPVVLAREDAPGDRRLVAYYLADEPVAVDALKSHLAERLPEYMVPAAYVRLEALPLTPNGKVDRNALPAPTGDAYAAREYEAPVGETEQAVAAIWAAVLGAERVGRHDGFLDLGGHSLLATQVVSRVRERFGVELPLSALFEGPTVAELAGRVEEVRQAELPVVPPVVPVERTGPLPLSFAQERLWFLHQMEPEGTRYNGPWPSRLRGHLDASALERALDELVRRHEALRTTFRPVERGAVQIVHPAAPAHLPVVDLTGLAPRDREDEARRLAREDAERLFDLERGPLLRATLVRLADDEHVLLLTMHHIVSDGWSMDVLFRELFTLYEWFSGPSDAAGAASPLPPLAVQYADFAVWQRGWLRGEVLRRQIDWWRERLGGAPPALELPTDRPRPAVASSRGAAHVFRIPAQTTRGLRALARREGATLYMVAHAAFDLLLSRWSGQEDLVVGSPIAGRTQGGTEGLIGFFVNTLALRIDLSGDPSFRELMGRVRETALGAYAHQELPFERLVEEVAPDRGLSHTPLFQVMFALQNLGYGEGPAIAGLRLEPFGSEVRTFGSESGTVRFDLELDITEAGEELVGSLRYRTDLFDAATMERFAAQYGVVLAAAGASPEERLSRLALLPADEARTLLAYGSGPAREDAGIPVHHLFAAQAARTPQAPAIRFESDSLTYAELDARAESLAVRLRGLGVGVGTTVAVSLERGPGVLVALLAVWKAGGVYLPLDPAHPAERLSFLLGDSGAKLVVTETALAGRLAERNVEVVLLDGITTSQSEDETGAAADVLPGDLAYLIYTSGSTGTPKAVMVEHAQLTHTLRGSLETLGFASGDVVAALASTSFDISLLELVTPLMAGGAVRIVPHAVVRDPETLVEAVADVTVLHAVPALMRQVVEAARGGVALPSLRLLLVGGDSVPPDLLEDMREVFPGARTVVLYGPTEATIICATYAVPAEGAVVGHPLGRPLPGVHLAVRGPRGEMAPLGVPGELWISGAGVARGYLGRPELNADKFVGAGTERAYRTGDRARWRADGVLEFLGRGDEQVKVRGFRIEPGEVEAVLREQPGVREAVVLAREDAPGDRRLVAYVVPGADEVVEVADAAGKEQVSEWETLFDDTYAQEEGEDPTLALKGWNSSYTGEPIPAEEMRGWVEDTVDRILALRPERVLEVGAGTGLLLFRVAPHTQAYVGTDFSAVALEHIRRHAGGLPQVSLAQREGDQLDEYAGADFDVVIVNSVAQYFPDLGYLLRVLDGAAAALRPGGRIFLGDVRSLPLAGAFHASVELARASDDLSVERLRDRVRRGVAEEQELLLDPALFEAVRARMPRLGRVEVQVKRGEYDNEVSRFRYDVVLHLDTDRADAAAPVVREWGGEDAAGLRALAEGSASTLVRGVPDARVREHVRAYELVSAGGAGDAAMVRARAAADVGGVAPEALFALGDELARGIEVRPGAAGTLDVLFHPAGGVAQFPAQVDPERPWETYANDPQWGRRMRTLVPALREAARARLPEYMVPSAFVVLESFPVTPNGKVDRGALPAPDTGAARGTYVAPRTPAEERMAGIWAEVLGVERVGAEDHFFDLGGHSLLATQLVSRVREAFGAELPLRAVFEAPALAALVGRVEALRTGTPGDAAAPPLVPVPRDGSPLPLSFAQQRQWFIDQMEGAGAAYHVAWRVRLRGPLDPRVLERALQRIVARHESLRTTFPAVQGEPRQRIAPADEHGFALLDQDLAACADVESELRRLAAEELAAPFDLAVGPLVRARLVRIAADDHALMLTMHHAVSDGWSVGVLVRELEVLYPAFLRGEADPLPPLPVQYADFAVWHRRWATSPVMEAQAEYWTRTLAGAPELLEVPADRPRPARQDFGGASVKVELDEALTAALKALSQRHGTTPFMTLLAGWAVVLARLSGQNDVVVGAPSAGRGSSEIEGLIGFFVNTLALRVELSGAPTVAELLGHVRERALEAQRNQDFPFEQVVERVQPARSLSHTPLFQVVLAWQEMTGGELKLPGIDAAPLDGVEEEAAGFDLMLSLAPRGGRIAGELTYATALFDRATVERYAGYLRRVLQEMAADDTQPIDQLELLSAAERARVVVEWNRTAAAYPRESCIHTLFEAQAARTPDAVAVEYEGHALSYAELNARANRLAHHLRALGVGPDARVALCVERGVEMIVAMLAVLKAGGAYVPLDPSYPDERLRYMLADSRPAVLLASRSQAARFAAAEVPVLDPADESGWAHYPDTDPRLAGLSPDHLCYVIYTSGSTGRPKGVAVPHRGVASLLADMQRRAPIGEGDGCSLWTSTSFDVSVYEIFSALLAGGRLCIPRDDVRLEAGAFLDWMEARDVHSAYLPPYFLAELRDRVVRSPGRTRLHRLLVGVEPIPEPLLAEIRQSVPGLRIINGYGPTETTICATLHDVPDTARGERVTPIGPPAANTRVFVVDARMQPVPVGVVGELYVGGVGVARGYLDRPALTAERFVPDPLSGEPGARLYRTGDLGRWLPEGALAFAGRTDAQVKVRGYRVEPGEIEARLAEHPAVREAVVVAREDAPGDKRLVAYYRADEPVAVEALKVHLAERLVEHMVPAAYVRLDAMPLTPSGKVDRRALPAPGGDAFAARGYEAPSSSTEETVAGIWAELLGARRVGRRDHFFDLGGHSLLAVRAVSRVRQALGVEAMPRDMFERPVLADFARGLETAARADATAIMPVDRTGPIPLSFAQQRLWFLEQLGDLGDTYHIPMGLRLRGTLDHGALVRSLDRIVARHEALRTSFAMVEGEPVQHIAPVQESGFRLAEHDLRASPDAEDALRRLVQDEASAPFDLARGPLFRGRLIRMAADDHMLLLTMHHIVSDGWSAGVLFRELAALYTAFARGEPDPLPPLPIQYADYAVWHRRWVEGPVLEAQAEYWTRTLAGAPELLELPTDHPRPAKQEFAGASVDVELDEALAAALRTLSQRHGTTLFMTLLAGWAAVLARLSGQDDVVIGTPTANRGRAEVEELIGFFVNTLPLRVDLSGAPTAAGLLDRVRSLALEAQRNQDIPFEQVVERVHPTRSLAHSPLFQVMFTWQNAAEESLELPGLVLDPADSQGSPAQVRAKFDLSLSLQEDGGRIVGTMDYATALFDRATVERHVECLRRVLEEMVADDARAAHALEMLPAAERRLVVDEWNRTGADLPAVPAHQLFEAQVEKTPDATAVVFGADSLTYAELNARANRLARWLRGRGVGAEVRVGLSLERAPEMVVAVLGVLKAGGAYVPLDPSYPAERLAYMATHSALPVVLTQERLLGRLPFDAGVEVVALDARWGEIEREDAADAADPSVAVDPRSLAYVLYTSGSTGRPKGVAVEHAQLAAYLAWATRTYPGGGSALHSSLSFDLTVTSLFVPLLGGGAVELVEEENAVEGLARVLERGGREMLKLTPAHLRVLGERLSERGAVGGAACLVVGGEPLIGEQIGWWIRNLPETVIVNEYGPTETVVGCSIHSQRLAETGAGQVSIGRPVANTRIYTLDARGEPAPIGVPGELYVGGAQVTRGYLGRPGLTAERFVPDPFSLQGGARMYRTGDLGRWRADGTLEYLGRTDFQVKVRGFRIELGEIEAVLRQHEGVADCAVMAREDAGDQRLVAYVVGEVEADALRAHVRRALPEYMVPSAFVFLSELPLTTNGKLDRKALPAPEYVADADQYVAPRTPAEEVIAAIWAEVLKVDRVGVHDNFFTLGGHSLLAVTLIERMRRRGVRADVRALFATPTVAELAAAAGGGFNEIAIPPNRIPAGCDAITPEMLPLVELTQAEIDRIVAGVPGGAANVQDIYPLAPLQEGILFHHLLTREGDPYLLSMPFAFESREQVDAYLAALQAVIARHDVLRTAVVWEGLPEPVQVVWRQAPLSVEEVEVDPAGDAARQLYERFDPRHHRIDLGRAPLLRACVTHDVAEDRWVLLLLQHHMTSDHTSLDVLRAEIDAHLEGRADQLPAPLPFRNYVAQARLGASRAEHEAFFGELLGDVDEPTAPFGLRDVHGDGLGLEEGTLEVEEGLGIRLRERARALGVSAASVCHVAWAQVLARVSGRSDVVFGTVLLGRMQGGEGADQVLGPFINTLPVRIQVAEAGAVTSVRRTQALLASLVRHEHASLVLAQQMSGVQAPEPLFSAVLNYRHGVDDEELRPASSGIALETVVRERSNYPLILSVNDQEDRFSLTVQVQPGIGAERVCALMNTALAGLVETLDTAPERPLETIEVLPEAERRQVLEEFNATRAESPGEAFVHELFAAQAERTRGAAALVFEDEALSYGELNARANRLAHYLRSLGVGPETRVGLCVERSPEMVVGVLAVLKAGGAYVPLDPGYPAERLAYMLADSAPAAVLVQTHLRDRVEAAGVPVVELDAAGTGWASLPATDPGRDGLTADHLAYVIYTSGSTGRPKGVRVPHASVAATLAVAGEAFGFDADDRVPSLASFAFDIWIFETLLPLLGGGSVQLVPRDRVVDVPRLVEDLASCTAVHAVPALMRRIVEEVRTTPEGVLGTLRHAFVGGDAVAPDLLEEMRTAFPAAEIHVLYGPTEAAIICASHRLGGETAARQMVGRPLGNAALYVVDPEGRVAPVGVAGELWLGGASVARDYLGRPGLTAERFAPDPFSAQPGARLYRTGDRVRWLADGSLEFLGRTDLQVKVRGFRIEPGEIEARLAEHPGVREAVVLVREDARGEKRLVAYVAGDETAGADVLRAHLGERLPEYMVPAAYVRLDALPLTPNGKVDRKALPAPEGNAYSAHEYEAPVGQAEQAVAAIWSELLGAERVGRRDHFFDLGGHSLLAVRVISRVRQALGVEVSPRDVFERPVLADFARGLETAARADATAITQVDRTAPIPLSFAQQRLWFLEQLGNLGSTYHMPLRLRLRGELDRGALVRALDRIVARHEALRTSFPTVDEEPVQHIAPAEESGFRLVEHDLRASADAEDELRGIVQEETNAPFDLARGPLFRGRLIRMAADDNVLLLTMHHIVSDGWSAGVLHREVGLLYAAFARGEPDPLPPLPIQYADYAVWHRQWVEGPVLEAQAEYWTQTLAGAPELLELPTDHPRPAKQDFAGGLVGVELDEGLAAALRTLSQRHGTTLFMTLLAGWAAVLARLSGQDDVVIGTPSANRGRAEVEDLIGFFVNTLPVRIDLSDGPRVGELIDRVKARVLEAQQNQDIPFEQVVDRVQPARSMAHTPIFQVMFAWQNAPGDGLELPGLALGPLDDLDSEDTSSRATSKFDLSLTLWENGGRIDGVVEYATALFDRATVERHAGYLRRVLEEMAADDAKPVHGLDLLSAAERRTVVEAWNDTDATFSAGACIHELFEAQAARAPGAVAVSFQGERLTYAELNARANRLAHHLRALGVGPDARVGVCVERGAEMVVSLLAILKSGGAYVPLDPAYPADRLRYMLEDSAPAALITQSSLADTFAGLDVPVVELDAAAWAAGPDTNPMRAGLTPDHLAYVIYTSGSTGRPKGVMVAHRSLVNHTAWQAAAFGIGANDTVLQRTSISFDASVWVLWTPLASGARMLLLSSDVAKDPEAMGRAVEEGGVTIAQFVPTLLQAVLGALPEGGSLPCRILFCGGEALSAELVEEARSAGVGEVVNLYGPTEATIDSTSHVCAVDGRAPAIGQPIANARMYVLDARGALAPVGVAGELYVGGAGVARGYLSRAGLTAERFVPDPFSTEGGARMYRTGDLGRWRADGTLEFMGRTDFQVKVRGFRIELGEIEAALRSHDAIRDALVLAREDAPGDRRLVAYYLSDQPVAVDALKAHLAGRLPEHMVPAAHVWMEAFPRTPNGKTDRRALPAPGGDAFAARGYEAPEGETEEAVAAIWTGLLGVERVGRHDDFFQLGGNSLLATRLVFRIRREMDVELSVSDVFEKSELSLLAQHLVEVQLADFDPELLQELLALARAADGG
ncbi:non-ribosomal peptide synthase/polyketide synthase [Longimicrobium sp.]|uniref:non-ribosomal peptide synthase/polyketide synthase n=1 Tax=Longimicrobium sp. TaxID=2029185 RepID=UPI003B3B44B5